MSASLYTRILAVSAGIVMLGSCEPRRDSNTASGAVDTLKPADSAPAATAGSEELTDANIVALLDEANMADSAAGAYALAQATNADVKDFARLMMGEHHALRAQGQQLAQRLNITPKLPANDPLKPAAESEMAALRAAPKGAQFDRTYIEQEVAAHKLVLEVAEKGHGAAQNEELKKLIEQAKPVIEKHLERAEEIQKKLGKPAA